MEEIIDTLLQQRDALVAEEATNGISNRTEHGSPEQTRTMLFSSMFAQAIGNIDIAIAQCKILQKELY